MASMVSRMEKRFSYYYSLSLRFKAQAFFAWENTTAAFVL